jgi:hypothetical protein
MIIIKSIEVVFAIRLLYLVIAFSNPSELCFPTPLSLGDANGVFPFLNLANAIFGNIPTLF